MDFAFFNFFRRALGPRETPETPKPSPKRPSYGDLLEDGIRSGRDAAAWLDAMNEQAEALENRDFSDIREFCAEMRKLGYRVECRISNFRWYGGAKLEDACREISLVVDYNASEITAVYPRNGRGHLDYLYWKWPHRLSREPDSRITKPHQIAAHLRRLAAAIGEYKGVHEDLLPARKATRDQRMIEKRKANDHA